MAIDPIISNSPFGQTPAWPPSPAKLDRDLDLQNHQLLNIAGTPINLATNVTGKLPYANIQQVTGQRLLGATTTGDIHEITIGSNLTLTGDTLSAATSGGAGTGDFSTNTSVSVANEIVLFSNTTGKQGKRSTGTGSCTLSSGVLSVGQLPLNSGTYVTGQLIASSMPQLTGHVTTPGGSLNTTITNGVVTDGMLAGGITATHLVGTDITTLGTITSGQWAATPVPVAFGGTGSTSVAAARAALGIETITNIGDANYSAVSTDAVINLNAALTAVRTVTLPQASTVNSGAPLKVVDGVGGVTTSNYIQIAPFAGDTINGSTNNFLLNIARRVVSFVKTGATSWAIYYNTPTIKKRFFSNQTYTTPVGVTALFAEVIAGGGAGGGSALTNGSNLSLGSGGGAGGYANVYISAPLPSYLITIGTGGTGVAGGTGNTGGTTSFGAACSASGGLGGQTLSAGTSQAAVQGGAAGAGTAGDLNFSGSPGTWGFRTSSTFGISGAGGGAPLGYGPTTPSLVSQSAGSAAGLFGSGGSGALSTNFAAQAGGAGSDGIVLLTEFY